MIKLHLFIILLSHFCHGNQQVNIGFKQFFPIVMEIVKQWIHDISHIVICFFLGIDALYKAIKVSFEEIRIFIGTHR